MLAKVGKISGKTVKFLILLAKTLTDDRERGKQVARLALRSILPELAKKFIRNTVLHNAINWKLLADLLVDWFFDKVVEELNLDEFLRQILDEIDDFLLETTFRLALTFAMHAASIGVSIKQVGKDAYLMFIAGPKGKRIVFGFRF